MRKIGLICTLSIIAALSIIAVVKVMPCSAKSGAWGYGCDYQRCEHRFDCNIGCVCFKAKGPIYDGVCIDGN